MAVRRLGSAEASTPVGQRHAAVRPRQLPSSSRQPTALGFKAQTPRPSPQSQSFSRSYGSILPTSLIYIVLSTRGCTPWRPEAVMSTTRGANKSRHWVFTGRRKRTGQYKKILLCQSLNLIAGQSDSKVYRTVKKKRELFPGLSPASPISFVLPLNIHVLVREY